MVTFSSTNFSPNLVLPSPLLKKLLPSSAWRASIAKNMFSNNVIAAVGSKITVYLPGSKALAVAEPVAFDAAYFVAVATSNLFTSLNPFEA